MNWLDWLILVLLLLAAFKGYQRGFIVEVASLAALLLGLWAGVHLSSRVAEAIGMAPERTALAFLITFLLVLIGVHLLARLITSMINAVQLGLPNRLAGTVFGLVRAAFVYSVLLNVLAGVRGDLPALGSTEGSRLHDPLQALAPTVVPALGETKWVAHTMDRLKQEAIEIWEGGEH